jgi:exosortase/archaeosortase family protein
MSEKFQYIEKFVQEVKTGKKFLSRFFAFLLLLLLSTYMREWYTKKYFGYELLISDGYVRYGVYALSILFVILSWSKLKNVSFRKHALAVQIFFFLAAFASFFIPLPQGHTFKMIDRVFFEYSICFLGSILLFFSVFGLRFFKERLLEIATLLLMVIPLKTAPLLIDHFWGISSQITMYGLKLIFPVLQVPYTMDMPTYMVAIKSFRAYIGPPCAGIHSLLGFTVLFVFALFLFLEKARKISLLKTFGFFFLGLVLVFLLNSLRVALILIVGAYISPDFAITTFHNNIGAILFMIFFILYSTFVLKHIEKK